MKLCELIGFLAFAFFVSNCIQFDEKRKACEKVNYEATGCSVHKKIAESAKK